MKKLFIAGSIILLTLQVSAQTVADKQRTITVNGSSEAEVTPDEIYVQVQLREYKKKNGDKTDINSIKSNFLQACRSIGLTEKDVVLQSFDGYDNNYWYYHKNKKQNPDMMASITYLIKLSSTQMMDQLVDKMDDEATQNFFIAKTSYSKMDSLKQQLKIEAIKAAKKKAEYLTAAIDTKLGQVVTINDPVETGDQPRPVPYNANMMMKVSADSAGNENAMAVDFKKIKIGYEVNVVFDLN